MAIKGLTDSVPEAGLYPVIGKLRKGAKKTDPKKPGRELEYWRFTSEYPGVEAAFYAAYNPEPKIVNVVLPYPRAFGEVPGEVNFTASMEEWRGALVLVHRCDGEYCYRWYDDGAGKYVDDPGQELRRPCPYSDLAGDEQKERTTKHPGCRARGRLSVIVPELVAAGHVGVVIVQTGGQHDIAHIIGVLNRVQRAVERRDKTLEGVPFTLMRVSEVVSTPGWEGDEPGTRRRSEKHNVKLVPVADWESATLAALEDDATPRLLPASTLDDGNGDIEGDIIENGAATEGLEDDGPAEESEPEDTPPADLPASLPNTWPEFAALAVEQLGFNHKSHVLNAYRRIVGEPGAGICTGGDQKLVVPAADLWAQLADYQRAKVEETE